MTSTRAGDERQRMARIAALASPPLAALIPATMPFVGYSRTEAVTWAALMVPTVLLSAAIGWFLPWRRWPDLALLAVPLAGFAHLGVLGIASDGRASVYGGYSALLFLFIGLTQRPWTSIAVLPLGLVTFFALYSGPSGELVARLPISITVWLSVAEIVARYRTRTGHVVDDLETQAHVDPLTGLGNRHDLGQRLRELHPDDAVLLVDLDHFKRINDEAGHAAGDHVLHEFGAVVRSVIRGGDRAIRYGGEEFLILLRESTAEGAARLDHRLRVAWAETRPDVTYSGGIAVVGQGHPQPVLARADQALYAAKAGGRDRTIVHDDIPAAERPRSAVGT
jgi:diguanylate cyclase (GGDEF)-like protein